ncbi:MAG TPA: divalent-cation tolerance protein CutA [Vicinamibacterales bacterium]|jgi:periplasmic divalent cation tolerance protein
MRDTPIPSVSIVLTTFGKDDDARAVATVLVEERLAACVNILPRITSIYAWKGSVSQDEEQQLVIKTSTNKLAALEARLRELHPYEVPEFVVIHANGGADSYLDWVRESTTPEARS